jgi:hypothetical protein
MITMLAILVSIMGILFIGAIVLIYTMIDEQKKLKSIIIDHESLNREYKETIEILRERKSEVVRNVVIVPPSNQVDTSQYLQQIGMICEAQWFVHFFEELKRDGIERFTQGKESPEYWRGWIALIGKIFDESRNCKPALERIAQQARDNENKN